MSDGTKIEWTDATWNPITGCSVVSAGCKNCYAMKLAGTRLQHHPSRAGLTIDTSNGPVWNGEVRFNEQWLSQPLKWKRPRMIFVCAHGDLFHESVQDEWIDQVFAVMALAPHHTFQVLTKRAERMRAYLQTKDRDESIGWDAAQIVEDSGRGDYGIANGLIHGINGYVSSVSPKPHTYRWPLPNVWLGVSVEHQEAADERIPLLLQTPAAVRWISAEPLLGPVDLRRFNYNYLDKLPVGVKSLDWVVAGGESGLNARPMHPDWAIDLRDQCNAVGVPFLFKQWGEWEIASIENGHHDSFMTTNNAHWVHIDGVMTKPSCLRPAEVGETNPRAMVKVGKKAAGRTLDGRTWDEYPKAGS